MKVIMMPLFESVLLPIYFINKVIHKLSTYVSKMNMDQSGVKWRVFMIFEGIKCTSRGTAR